MTKSQINEFAIAIALLCLWPFAVLAGCRALYLSLCRFTEALGVSVDPGMFSAQAVTAGLLGFVIVTALLAAVAALTIKGKP